jgi:UDP-N-acetylglucosamine 2-epimerase (non-hydrolysing)
MPEEINRIVTDSLCDILLTPSRDADENLKKEGVESNRIHLVGNIMIDTLQRNVQKASNKRVAESFGLERGKYAVVTLHRPSNVDNRDVIGGILNALGNISQEIPLIFPAHPRTSKMISAMGLEGLIEKFDKLIFTDPMGYLDFLSLVSQSKMVLTDSGGLQEETTALGIPCLTLRDNTERPITVSEGTNTIVGNLPESIITAANEVILTGGKSGRVPELWDGNTAFRIAGIIEETIASTI